MDGNLGLTEILETEGDDGDLGIVFRFWFWRIVVCLRELFWKNLILMLKIKFFKVW